MAENRNVAVGLFVTVAIILFVGFTVWISGKKGDEETRHYSILFERDVSGLMLGGPVFFLGVNIGQVDNMVIVAGDPVRIRVDIEVLASAPVDSGTWATLAPQGITGVSVINLSSDPGDHEPLDQTPGFEHPVIAQRDTGLSAIMSSAPAILEKMQTLLDRASLLLDPTNQALVRDTLVNIESVTGALADQQAALASVPGDLQATLAQIRDAGAQLSGLLETAGPGVTASVESFEAAAARLDDITGQLETWLVSNDAEVEAFVANGLGQVPALIEDARRTLREMEKLMANLRADPDRLIYKTQSDAVPSEE